jgi:quinol monooxygenase YgiN
MEMSFIARFHVRAGAEAAAEAAMLEVGAATEAESGCLEYRALRARSDRQAFVIYSRWRDEAAFDLHADLPHTRRYLETMNGLIDRETEFTRAEAIV